MIRVLIPTKPDDNHAIYVKMALQQKGHDATLWYTADYPEIQKHSFELQDKKINWQSSGLDFSVINNQEYDVVWLRRPRRPMVPDFLHPDDKENAIEENSEFFKTIWQVIAPDACWINPVDCASSVNCKLLQLKVAAEVGLNVPDSLFSNDPEKIKNFIDGYEKDEVIYKVLRPVYWLNKESMKVTYTKEINHSLLPSDAVLQSTPGIYQNKIKKEYELRVTYFGDQCIAVKLNSQEHPKGMTDWRLVPARDLVVEQYDFPEEVDKKCREFMKKMGVVFGCFDFIVTPDHEYYFLEINEQGQFLWIEEINPDIQVLEAFTNFIIKSGGGRVLATDKPVSLSDFRDAMKVAQKNAMSIHKDVGLVELSA